MKMSKNVNISKIKTTLWFISRPRYWVQYLEYKEK